MLAAADEFFPEDRPRAAHHGAEDTDVPGPLGALAVGEPEGGHYTFVQVETDQMGESRLDRNVKKFFVALHRADDPAHRLTSSY